MSRADCSKLRGGVWLRASLVAIVAFFSFLPSSFAPAAQLQPRLISHIGGPTTAVATEGDRVYYNEGPALVIARIFHPEAPVEEGRLYTGAVIRDIAVANHKAVVLVGRAGLCVADCSNPSHPILVGQYQGTSYLSHLRVSGGTVYAVESEALVLLDVSNPQAPNVLGRHEEFGKVNDIAVGGNLLLLSITSAAVALLDVSDPRAPRKVGELNLIGGFSDAIISGDYAYVLMSNRLVTFDLTNLHSARVLSELPLDLYRETRRLNLAGKHLLIADSRDPSYRNSRVRVVNVANPTAPFVRGELQENVYLMGVATSAHFAYLAAFDDGVLVVDAANPDSLIERRRLDAVSLNIRSIVVQNATVVAGGNNGELRFFDVSNPSTPELQGRMDVLTHIDDMTASGGWLYIADDHLRLAVVDGSDPTVPSLVRSISGRVDTLAVSGSLLVLAQRVSGFGAGRFSVYDVTDPTTPRFISVWDDHFPDKKMIVRGNRLFVFNAYVNVLASLWTECRLDTFDLSSGGEPILLGSTPVRLVVTGTPRSMAIIGNSVLVSGLNGLSVVDITDPQSPIWLPTVAGYNTFASSGNLAAFSDTRVDRLWVFDFRDVLDPELIAERDLPIKDSRIAISGGLAYAGGPNGLFIIDLNSGQPIYRLGDVAGDGVVDASDLVELQRLMSSGAPIPEDVLSAGDLDEDGFLTDVDVTLLAERLLRP